MVIVALLFLTRAFELMPLNALAAIVIAGVSGLLDFPSFWRYLRVRQAFGDGNRDSKTSLPSLSYPRAHAGCLRLEISLHKSRLMPHLLPNLIVWCLSRLKSL